MNKFINITKKALFVLLMLFTSIAVAAKGPIDVNSKTNVAIKGYDTVAYFTEHQAVKGNEKYMAEYKGAKWYFSSASNLKKFKANPQKYAPQYGGYCAFAVSEQNRLVSTDPKVWKIVNGKLYLNFNRNTRKIWLSNLKEDLIKGNMNYPKLIKNNKFY